MSKPNNITHKGNNITFTCRNKQNNKSLKQHSHYIYKQMLLKYPEENPINQHIDPIKLQQEAHPRPKTSTSSIKFNASNLRSSSTFHYSDSKGKSGKTLKTRKQKKALFQSLEHNELEIVENGWKMLTDKKKISDCNMDKIKQYRNTCGNIKHKSRKSYMSHHQKVPQKQQILTNTIPFSNILSSNPDFLCEFSTGLTHEDQPPPKNSNLQNISRILNKSEYLSKIYRKVTKSKHYSEMMEEDMGHNFVSLVHFLERYRNRCNFTEKDRKIMRKCRFV